MLILSRKVGERIMIGDDIEIVVREIQGNRIRIGIEAPKLMSVKRAELTTHRTAEQTQPQHLDA